MAVKKETAQQAAEAATQDDKASQGVQAEKPATEVIHLFKDNGRYSSARFVSVNGEAYLIQRGVDVEVPAAVAEVLRHSERWTTRPTQRSRRPRRRRRTCRHCRSCNPLTGPVRQWRRGCRSSPERGATNQRRIHPVRQALAVPGVFAKEAER